MAKDFFQKEDKQKIVDAIRNAELNTSGEIRVHIESYCPEMFWTGQPICLSY